LLEQTLEKWFEEVFFLAPLEEKVVTSVRRFKAASSNYDKQNMLLYEVLDLSYAGKLRDCPKAQ
jgi:hypothetical protein